jgi:hypothetical protein
MFPLSWGYILEKGNFKGRKKMCLLQNYYMTILTYGAEMQAWIKENISRPTAAEMRILKNYRGVGGGKRERDNKKQEKSRQFKYDYIGR